MRTDASFVLGLSDSDGTLPREHDIEQQVTGFDSKELFRTNFDSGQRGLVESAASE